MAYGEGTFEFSNDEQGNIMVTQRNVRETSTYKHFVRNFSD